jgi:dATP pyrophosphohydrolase
MERSVKIPESVLVVIHSAEFDVLLIERADMPGYWQSVTGSKDTAGEPFEATAIREVAEETGIVIGSAEVPRERLRDWGLVNVYDIYPQWQHRYAAGVTKNTEHVFGLCVPRSVPVTLAPREHVAHVWLPWREAVDRCSSASNAEAIMHLPRFAP